MVTRCKDVASPPQPPPKNSQTSPAECNHLENVFHFLFTLQSRMFFHDCYFFSVSWQWWDTCFLSAYRWETYDSDKFSNLIELWGQQKQSQASNPGLLMPKPVFFLLYHHCHLEPGKSLYFISIVSLQKRTALKIYFKNKVTEIIFFSFWYVITWYLVYVIWQRKECHRRLCVCNSPKMLLSRIM